MGETVRPKIMILGTFHMSETTDMHNAEIDDLSASGRQGEIIDLVNRLKRFQPTKIAVEVMVENDASLNHDYQQYRSGQLDLKISEVHQIGFRLAKALNHDKLFAIDWMKVEEGKRGFGDAYYWAKEHQPDVFDSVFGEMENEAKIDPTKNIVEIYQQLNQPSYIENSHKLHLNVARVGTFQDYVGMDWLTWWYQRNLILFSNLTRLASSDNERILFLVGASHVHLVSQFLEESGFGDIEKVEQYLLTNKIGN